MSDPDSNPADARDASFSEISEHLGEAKGESLYLGHYHDAGADRAGEEIRYYGDRHLIVFGPTGSGKGRRLLFPNLLTGLKEQSVIVIDPKGEAAEITANARRAMGHDVVVLNPFRVRGLKSNGFNPLASLDPGSDHFFDDAASIGEALIQTTGNDPHWPDSARSLIVALVMWEKVERKEKATLENVRQMLTERNRPGKPNESGVAVPEKGLQRTAFEMVVDGSYEIASLASRFTESNREISSVVSTATTQTNWLLSKLVREDLNGNGFDFSQLREKPTTVYLVLPAERLRTHSPWLRLVIVSALNALYRRNRPGDRRVTLMIDELAALGHLPMIEDAFGLIRGYNIQIAAFLQDLGQLKNIYKERWETFIANAGAVFGFAPNDLTTAEWMSKRSGTTTAVAQGMSTSSGIALGEKVSTSTNRSSSDQPVSRPLYFPQELMGLRPGMAMLWLAGLSNGGRIFAPDFEKIKACRERANIP